MEANTGLNAPAINQELQERVSRTQGIEQIQKSILDFRNAAAYYETSGKEGFAPVHYLAAEASSGKTRSVLDEISMTLERNPSDIIEYNLPTIELGEELVIEAKGRGISPVFLHRGRSQPRPDGSGHMCARAACATKISLLGMSVKETLCCSKDAETGEIIECAFAKTCLYLRQREEIKKGGLVIRAQQYLTLLDEGMPPPVRRYIDETFWTTTLATKTIDLSRFQTLRGTGTRVKRKRKELTERFENRRIEEGWELESAIEFVRDRMNRAEREHRQLTATDLRYGDNGETILTPELSRYLATLEYSHYERPKIKPNMDDATIERSMNGSKTSEAIDHARFWLNLALELASGKTGPLESIVIERGSDGNKIHLYWKLDIKNRMVPTLCIDADANQEINSRVLPADQFDKVPIRWQNVTIYQADKVGSLGTMKVQRNQQDAYNTAFYAGFLARDQIKGDRKRFPLMVAQKQVMAKVKTWAGDQIHTVHFGNIRGKDEFKHSVAVVIAGRREPTVEQVEKHARCLNIGSRHQLTFLEPTKLSNGKLALVFPKRKVIVTAKNGKAREVPASYHPDPLCDAILRQIRETEIMQAIARVRPVHRSVESPCKVIVLTSTPLPIQVDELPTWKELVPGPLTKVRMNGIQFLNMADMADAYPELFPSHAAARKAASRHVAGVGPLEKCDTGHIYNPKFYRPHVGQVRFSYSRKKCSRRRIAVVDLLDGETIKNAAARLVAKLPDAVNIRHEHLGELVL
ncbi:hypothetical protein HFO27_35420 [Rhizobium leguminosarum]|uniref:hypothetical protein n=1 Tax=Rhizobium leguminosarum TaxID=384 RepID=UPI001C9214CC|nr:hypothetical protein [Rhizobium leguminosarum]MBY3179774.1 hypothetical protein [Rhizobium leguminosarum]